MKTMKNRQKRNCDEKKIAQQKKNSGLKYEYKRVVNKLWL